MDALFAQIKTFAGTTTEADHKMLLDSLRSTAISLESPYDTMQRIIFLNLQIACVRIGIDLQIFNILAESSGPVTLAELAKKTGADHELLGRILRYLASVDMIKETGKNTFTANNVTKTLAMPGYQGAVHTHFDFVGPTFQEFPDFLKERKYKNINNMADTVHQKAWKCDTPALVWIQQHPEMFNHFHEYMKVQHEGLPSWLSIYPIEAETMGWNPEDPVFVDVGGNVGHQCAALKARFPDLPGKIILQDVPHAIEHAIPTAGVEATVHNFFEQQPVKGAKFYYMRNILHDYPDAKAVTILENIMAAMSNDSAILIDEMVLPDTGVHWEITTKDLTMMTVVGAQERTRDQWYALMELAGLTISKIYTYTPSLQESIIVAVPK